MNFDLTNFDASLFLSSASSSLASYLHSDARKFVHKSDAYFGGYFCMTDERGAFRLVGQIGHVPAGSEVRLQGLSKELGKRIIDGIQHRPSNDSVRNRFSGAVFFKVGLSLGTDLPWQVNEAICLRTALLTKLATAEEIQHYMRGEENNYLPETWRDELGLELAA